jgi:hypothetical protein
VSWARCCLLVTDRMAVVRVFGRSAKIRTLYHGRGENDWRK